MRVQPSLKQHVILVITLLLPYICYGQQEYFYSTNGKKVYMEIMENRFVVKPASPVTAKQAEELLGPTFTNARAETITGINDFYEIKFDSGLFTTQALQSELDEQKSKNTWSKVNPVYLIEGNPAIVYDVFVVNLKDESVFQKLEQLNNEYGVELISRNTLIPTMITLRVPDNSEHQLVELARTYFERLELEWSAPDFKMKTVLHTNDPYYPYQFYMDMISADKAWNISLSDQDITVAVVDQGVEAHEDLPAGQLVNGYDAFGQTGGAPGGNEAHGMASVGIIAANHNTDGIAGLAPNVRIMPVRIFNERGNGSTNNEITYAMTHAITNGADIISNSWGYSDNNGNSVTTDANPGLTTVINNASQNGRGGLGTVIIFASGNNGQDVTYPAFLNSVIAIGAINSSNTAFNYSNTGSSLDLVAPSGEVGTVSVVNCGFSDFRFEYSLDGTVWTLDREGASGWNPGDHDIAPLDCFSEYQWSTHGGLPTPNTGYTSHDGGTSAAAPQVSGTVALMLSINPNLTLSQIQNRIQYTADKVGPYTYTNGFNVNMGYGRVNAYKAVREALPSQYSSQNFTSSTSLSNSAHMYGTTNIGNSVTVTIPSGQVMVLRGTVNGGTNSKITSYGKVIIEEGTVLNDVEIVMESGGELLPSNIELDGKGIVFKSGSDGEIKNSTITNANRGIELNGSATPLIEGNIIEDNAHGIWINSGVGSGAQIINNALSTNSGYGIASYYSSPTINYNYFNGNYFFGLGSTASFYRNRFNSSNYGLQLLNNSAVQNATRNLVVSSGTTFHVESPVTVQLQYNDTWVAGTTYLVRANYNALVFAYNNYWGGYPSSSYYYSTNGANIYYSQSPTAYVPEYHKVSNPTLVDNPFEDVNCTEKYNEVSALLSERTDEETKRALLTTKAGCYRSMGIDGFIEHLQEEVRTGLSTSSKLYATSS